MAETALQGGRPGHVAGVVDTPCRAEIAAKGTQVSHRPIVVQEGMSLVLVGLRLTHYLASGVDAELCAVRAAQGTQADQFPPLVSTTANCQPRCLGAALSL